MDKVTSILQGLSVWAIPVLFAVTVHEVAHGWLANKLGDKTAFLMGRITLNPLKHIDLFGTIIVPMLFFVAGGFIFGWAKPVPVDWRNLRNARRDKALVAAVGPAANGLMALLWAFVAKIAILCVDNGFHGIRGLVYMGLAGISVNVMFMILNLLPIPPLDGSRVVASCLSSKWAAHYERIEPYGFMILILLIFSRILSNLLEPLYEFFQRIIFIGFAL